MHHAHADHEQGQRPRRSAELEPDQDDLSNAVGLNSASFNLARMIGPALEEISETLGGNLGVLVLAGGEPFTRKDFPEIVGT